MHEIVPVIKKENDVFVLENYDLLKTWLSEGCSEYLHKEYKDIDEALKDKEVLDGIKKSLKDVQKQIKEPYDDVEKKLDDLIKILQEPLTRITKLKQELEYKQKAEKIMDYARIFVPDLGAYAEKILSSGSFLEHQWLTAKFSEKKWRDAVGDKISSIIKDLNTINNVGGKDVNALLARYYETLSLDNTEEYLKNLNETRPQQLETREEEDKVVGYKILKIYGTHSQMSQVLDELDLLGLDYEEIEDGMPKEFEEIKTPDMDSFIAFDIETSGSEGATYNGLPSDITEIGAVKVIDGHITETFSELCNPGRQILPRIERLTGITNEMVADKPSVNEVIKQFKEFCGDLPLVGHNIRSMDLRYISAAVKRNGIDFSNKYFDTYLYAKKFKESKDWDNVKLEYLAGQYGIRDDSHHRAYNDAQVNAAVYFKLKEEDRSCIRQISTN